MFREIHRDQIELKKVYDYAFLFAKESDQRNIDIEVGKSSFSSSLA